jgi:hypothetical protein
MVQTLQPPASRSTTVPDPRLTEFLAHREQAEAVLRSLIEAREECDRQVERFKRSDLFKTVTGRSALDSAISSTKKMIEHLDRCLAAAARDVERRSASA